VWTARVNVRLGAEPTTEVAVVLGTIAFVREHRDDADHDREGSQEQPLEDECVVGGRQVGGSARRVGGILPASPNGTIAGWRCCALRQSP